MLAQLSMQLLKRYEKVHERQVQHGDTNNCCFNKEIPSTDVQADPVQEQLSQMLSGENITFVIRPF